MYSTQFRCTLNQGGNELNSKGSSAIASKTVVDDVHYTIVGQTLPLTNIRFPPEGKPHKTVSPPDRSPQHSNASGRFGS